VIGFVSDHHAPGKRARFVDGGVEKKFSEGAVQLAIALAFLSDAESDGWAEVFPDGEHGKRFPIKAFLAERGFVFSQPLGSTSYGGVYRRGNHALTVNPKSAYARGDVVSSIAGRTVRVECKGATINSAHSGVKSRIRSGMAEMIGQAMAMEENGDRHAVAMPWTIYCEQLARRLAQRCRKSGIEIMLVRPDGSILWVDS
jgi:hypothetical protein